MPLLSTVGIDLTTDQTVVTGVKTFEESPLVPDADVVTGGNAAVNVNALRTALATYLQAGYALQGTPSIVGTGNTVIGPNAGVPQAGGTVNGSSVVLIGQDAGLKSDGTVSPSLSNRLYVQDLYTRAPLITGEFDNAKISVGALPISDSASVKGTLHVFTAATTLTPNASADDLVIEGSGTAGISFLTSDTGIQNIFFAISASASEGFIQTNHNSGFMRFGYGGEKLRITASGIGFFAATPVAAPTLNAAATDLTTVIALCNQIRAGLIAYGLAH